MRLAKKAAAVMAYLSSRALMQQVFWKKQITQAKKLFETTKQAPSPSKDYVHVLVTEGGVVVRRFPITLRGVTQGAVPCPTEKIVTLEEFQIDVDLQSEIGRTFGSEILTQVQKSAGGNWDIFLTLESSLVIRIVSLLDLQSIAQLSHVNHHMRDICNSPRLWEILYNTHQGRPSGEISALAREIGWKKVFFMNKLQLQKEVSRRRTKGNDSVKFSGELSPESTFLTES